MRDGIEGTGGLLIKDFLTLYFYAYKNYQHHNRSCRSRHILFEI